MNGSRRLQFMVLADCPGGDDSSRDIVDGRADETRGSCYRIARGGSLTMRPRLTFCRPSSVLLAHFAKSLRSTTALHLVFQLQSAASFPFTISFPGQRQAARHLQSSFSFCMWRQHLLNHPDKGEERDLPANWSKDNLLYSSSVQQLTSAS
jgi:hypothetical protein